MEHYYTYVFPSFWRAQYFLAHLTVRPLSLISRSASGPTRQTLICSLTTPNERHPYHQRRNSIVDTRQAACATPAPSDSPMHCVLCCVPHQNTLRCLTIVGWISTRFVTSIVRAWRTDYRSKTNKYGSYCRKGCVRAGASRPMPVAGYGPHKPVSSFLRAAATCKPSACHWALMTFRWHFRGRALGLMTRCGQIATRLCFGKQQTLEIPRQQAAAPPPS